jgi:hypothetical protein
MNILVQVYKEILTEGISYLMANLDAEYGTLK